MKKKSFVRWAGALLVGIVLGSAAAAAPGTGGNTVNARQRVVLGDERMAQGNYLGAAFQYERAVAQDSNYVDAYYKLARAYTEMGRTYKDYLVQAGVAYDELAPKVGIESAEYRKNYADYRTARDAHSSTFSKCTRTRQRSYYEAGKKLSTRAGNASSSAFIHSDKVDCAINGTWRPAFPSF